jgi:hypothetical protein
MKWLRRLFIVLLGLGLAATSLAWTTDATLWNSRTLQTAADMTQLSANIARHLPEIISRYSPNTPVDAIISRTASPAYVENQIRLVIPPFVDAFRHGAEVPKLNLTELNQPLSAASVTLPPGLSRVISTPQPLVPSSLSGPIRFAGHLTGQLRDYAPIASCIATLILIIIGGRRRLRYLAFGSLTGAVFTALLALLVELPPRFISAAISSSIASPLASSFRSFAQEIAGEQSHQLVFISIGLVILASGLLIAQAIAHIFSRFHRKKDEDPAVVTPTFRG